MDPEPQQTQGEKVGRRQFLQAGAMLGTAALLGAAALVEGPPEAQKTKLGIWPGGMNGLSIEHRRNALERAIGRPFTLDRARGNAYALDRPLVPQYVGESVTDGRRAYLKLQSRLGSFSDRVPVPWADVVAGVWDEAIRIKARRARSLPGWHYIAFHAEANVDTPGVRPPGTPAEFAAAFDHVRGIFDEEGADRLTWAAVLAISAYRDNIAHVWMPDRPALIGVDGYSKSSTSPDRALSFEELFQPAVDFAASVGRQVFIGEMGCQEDPGDTSYKADWIAAVPDALRRWKRCAAIMWNHSDDGDGGWFLDSSEASLSAFRAAAQDPQFV